MMATARSMPSGGMGSQLREVRGIDLAFLPVIHGDGLMSLNRQVILTGIVGVLRDTDIVVLAGLKHERSKASMHTSTTRQ